MPKNEIRANTLTGRAACEVHRHRDFAIKRNHTELSRERKRFAPAMETFPLLVTV